MKAEAAQAARAVYNSASKPCQEGTRMHTREEIRRLTELAACAG